MNKDRGQIFSAYLKKVERNCPYVSIACKNGTIKNNWLNIEGSNWKVVTEELLVHCFNHTEELYHEMVSYELYNNLLCRNVIVEFDDKYFENVYSEVLLSLAHGHLKQLLSSHGIVFGKFWKGEQASDRHGNTVAPTPYNFISIRSAQREYDLRFFQSPGKARDDFLRWKYSNQDRNLKFETDIALARSSVCEYLDSMEKEMRSKRVLH